jgi:hypothetical protein
VADEPIIRHPLGQACAGEITRNEDGETTCSIHGRIVDHPFTAFLFREFAERLPDPDKRAFFAAQLHTTPE